MQRSSATLMLAAVIAVSACAGDGGTAGGAEASSAAATAPVPGPGEPDLEAVRAATERFRDVNVALAEGYIPDPTGMCVTAEMEGLPVSEGQMGIHYFRPDLLGLTGPPDPRVAGTGTHTDFLTPGVLVYEPQADGTMELVAVENLVFREAWHAAGNAEAPTFHGVAYVERVDDAATEVDEAHGFEPHYELHVWLYRDNPAGVFAPFNTNVTCAHAAHAQMN